MTPPPSDKNTTHEIQNYEIHAVLVRTLYALNIGSTSRAMSNMGVHQLHLIQPQCEITFEAQQMAANGQNGLQNRRVYASWNEFLQENQDGIRIALSARDGRARKVRDLKESLISLKQLPEVKRSKLTKLYLFFGPEDCGLSGSEIDYTHYTCSLPTYGPNWSLNLAQAALLTFFIVRDIWGGQRTTLEGQTVPSQASTVKNQTENTHPEKILYEWIETLGFDLSKRRVNAYTVMKRILLHNVPTSKELRIFEVVIQQTIRKLKEHRLYQIKENNSTQENKNDG